MHLPPEIMRTASLLVDVYGEMAVAGAFIRADELGARGDTQGHDRWLQVARAAEALLSEERPLGISLH
jgi:hypothetical protein